MYTTVRSVRVCSQVADQACHMPSVQHSVCAARAKSYQEAGAWKAKEERQVRASPASHSYSSAVWVPGSFPMAHLMMCAQTHSLSKHECQIIELFPPIGVKRIPDPKLAQWKPEEDGLEQQEKSCEPWSILVIHSSPLL